MNIGNGLDDEISVAAVWPDGTVVVFGPRYKGSEFRERLSAQKFNNYGQGYLWAAEFEERERRDLAIRQSMRGRQGMRLAA
jgi:hypothetical protein